VVINCPADASAYADSARSTAEATICAAQIVADASRVNAFFTAVPVVVSLLGTLVAAYFAYRAARFPFTQRELAKHTKKDVLIGVLKTSVGAAIETVDEALEAYRGPFQEPVELRVLRWPSGIEPGTKNDLISLGAEINKAITEVGVSLDGYGRARAPIRDRMKESGDSRRTLLLTERPPEIDSLIAAAERYRGALTQLLGQLPDQSD
jgi:hypothetical protein